MTKIKFAHLCYISSLSEKFEQNWSSADNKMLQTDERMVEQTDQQADSYIPANLIGGINIEVLVRTDPDRYTYTNVT